MLPANELALPNLVEPVLGIVAPWVHGRAGGLCGCWLGVPVSLPVSLQSLPVSHPRAVVWQEMDDASVLVNFLCASQPFLAKDLSAAGDREVQEMPQKQIQWCLPCVSTMFSTWSAQGLCSRAAPYGLGVTSEAQGYLAGAQSTTAQVQDQGSE